MNSGDDAGNEPLPAPPPPPASVPAPPSPPPAWSLGDAFAALGAGVVASIIVGGLVFAMTGEEPTTAQLFGLIAPAQSLGTLSMMRFTSKRKGSGNLLRDFRVRYLAGDGWAVLLGAPLQIAAVLVLLPIYLLLDVDDAPQEAVQRIEDAGGIAIVVGFLTIGLLAPFVEELLFRGMLLQALLLRWSRRTALVASSAVFAAVHLLDPGAYLAVPPLFIVGLVLGYMTLRRGSIGWAILAHVGFNVTGVALVLVARGS